MPDTCRYYDEVPKFYQAFERGSREEARLCCKCLKGYELCVRRLEI